MQESDVTYQDRWKPEVIDKKSIKILLSNAIDRLERSRYFNEPWVVSPNVLEIIKESKLIKEGKLCIYVNKKLDF